MWEDQDCNVNDRELLSPGHQRCVERRERTSRRRLQERNQWPCVSFDDVQWRTRPGKAFDIAGGADGSIWAVGQDVQRRGGYGIYSWSGSRWVKVDGAAVRVALDPQGSAYVINDANKVYKRRDNLYWEPVDGELIDIGIGAEGSVWGISAATRDSNGNMVVRWDGRYW
jgi:hypothetical protein